MSYKEQLQNYEHAWDQKEMQGTYDIKYQQAKRLVQCGLSVTRLEELYEDATTDDDFEEAIRAKGVNSKPLREQLLCHLSTQFTL